MENTTCENHDVVKFDYLGAIVKLMKANHRVSHLATELEKIEDRSFKASLVQAVLGSNRSGEVFIKLSDVTTKKNLSVIVDGEFLKKKWGKEHNHDAAVAFLNAYTKFMDPSISRAKIISSILKEKNENVNS